MARIPNPNHGSVNRPNSEAVRSSLYDFQAYAALGQTSLSFFQVPVGQSGKTKADTNMEMAGSLPSPKRFVIETLELYFYPGVAIDTPATTPTNTPKYADDMLKFISNGYLDLFIGSKSYLTEAPLGRLPASTGMRVDSALAGTFAAPNMVKSEFAQATGLIYRIEPTLTLEPTQNFNVSLNWPTAIPMPSGVAGRVGVVMRGVLFRNSQ